MSYSPTDHWTITHAEIMSAGRGKALVELIESMSRMTDPSDLRNSTDPCDDAVETLSSLCLRARGILGLPEEFDNATETYERCGFRIDPDNATEDTCDCEPEPCPICERTEGHDKQCGNAEAEA